jgi:hypothetical protein
MLTSIMRGKLIVVAGITLVCLVAGYYAGRELGGGPPTVVPPTPGLEIDPVFPTVRPPSGQVVILLMSVDSRQQPKPNLEACWIITFQAGNPEYFLLGFPLDTPVQDGRRIIDYYSRGRSLEESTLFIKEAVVTLSDGSLDPQYVIVADRQLIAQIVDELGGISISGQTTNSQTLFAFYDSVPGTDYERRAEIQRFTLQALAEGFKGQPWSEASLIDFMKRFYDYSADADTLTRLAVDGLPYTQVEFIVHLSSVPTATPAP